MAGFGAGGGFVYGVMGNGGAGNAQPVIVPSDGGNSLTDAVTVVYDGTLLGYELFFYRC